MFFVVFPNKLQFRKLVCCTIHFHVLMLNIFIILLTVLLVCPLLFTWIFLWFTWSKTPCLRDALDKCFWNYRDKTTSVLCVTVCTDIFVSNCSLTGIWMVAIRWKMKLFYVAFMPSITSLLYPGSIIPRSIIILKYYGNIENNYIVVDHL